MFQLDDALSAYLKGQYKVNYWKHFLTANHTETTTENEH